MPGIVIFLLILPVVDNKLLIHLALLGMSYAIVASPEIFGFSLVTLLLSMELVGGIATICGPVDHRRRHDLRQRTHGFERLDV